MTFRRSLFVVLSSFWLAACGGSKSVEDSYVERPVEEIYNAAVEALERQNYITASQEFDEVERQHPYSIWARRALVMSAYTYYVQNKYDEAVATSRRFLALYPGNTQAPYAYYLIAMSQYERISDVKLDQRTTELARYSLVEVIRRYPGSDYAKDAALKLDLAIGNLAGKEMDVGRYYLNRGDYGAAAARFKNVVIEYNMTMHVEEALHRLTETYLRLGIVTEAQNSAAVLGYNFPDSRWYTDSYRILAMRDLEPAEAEGSWLSRTFDAVF
ncbi:outer membrane protein assembly factor BamD [Alphaproteobacteria bacterium]|nr:outer membrane protein assembly factor BamD [Alphaproteobacteria bacterium]